MRKKDHESVLNGLIILSWSAADTLQRKHLWDLQSTTWKREYPVSGSGRKGVWP